MKLPIALAILLFCAPAMADKVPDALVVTGPNLEQKSINKLLVTPLGSIQMDLATALSFGANLTSPGPIGSVTPNTGSFTTLGMSGLLHMSQPASIQFDSTRTWSGTQAAVGNAEIYSFTNQTGSTSTGNPIAFHYFSVASDTVQATGGHAIGNLRVDTNVGAGTVGGRINVWSNLTVNGQPSAGAQFQAGGFEFQATAPAGATGRTIGYGNNPTCGIRAGATGTWECVGEEVDIGASAGTTPVQLTGMQIVAIGHVSHGSSNLDSAYVIGNATSGNTTGWDYGMRMGGPSAPFPIIPTGTLFYAYPGSTGNTIANGFDTSNLTFTGNSWNDGHIVFTGSGVAQFGGAVSVSGSSTSPATMQWGTTSTPVPNATVTPFFFGYNSGAAFHYGTADVYGAMAIGDGTLQYLTSSNSEDVAYAPLACQYVTTGQTNTCLGYHTLGADSISSANTAVGNDCMRDAITFNGNGFVTCVGKWAIANGNPDVGTVAIGAEALMGDSSAIIIGGTPTTGNVITYTFNSSYSSFGNAFTGLPLSKTYTVQGGDTISTIATAIANGYNLAVTGNSYQLQAAPFALPDGTYAVRLTYMGSTSTGWQATITATWSGGSTETAAVVNGSRPQRTTAGGYKTLFGPAMGVSTDNSAWGWQIAPGCTTCSGLSMMGASVAAKVTSATNSLLLGKGVAPTNFATGSGVILLGSGAQAVDTPAGSTSNYINIENVITATGTDTPSTSITKIAGTLNSVGPYQANGTVGVSCAANTVTLATLVVTNGIVTHC